MTECKTVFALGNQLLSCEYQHGHAGQHSHCFKQNQAQLTGDEQQTRTGAYETYGRLGQYGNALTGLAGGVAGSQYQQDQASDPYASALAGATGVAGLFGQIYGGRKYS